MQVAVIGQRHGVHSQFFHALNQPLNAIATIKQAVFAMQVKVNKLWPLRGVNIVGH